MYPPRYNTSLRISIVTRWAALLALCATASVPAAAAPALTVDAVLRNDRGQVTLSFSIENSSGRAISLRQSALPWDKQFGALIVAVDNSTGRPLKRTPAIEDVFGPSPIVEMEPAKVLQGRVQLASSFAGVQEAAKGGNLVVFWYYAPRSEDGSSLGKYGGWLEL